MVGPLWEKSFHIPLEVYALQKVIKTLLLSDREETKLQKSLTWPAHSPGMWQQWGLNSSFLAQMPDISSGFWIFFFLLSLKYPLLHFLHLIPMFPCPIMNWAFRFPSLKALKVCITVLISGLPKHCPLAQPRNELPWYCLSYIHLHTASKAALYHGSSHFFKYKCPRSFLLLQKWLWNLPSQWSFSE